MSGVSEAFYEAVCAVGRELGVKPLPNGLNTAQIGSWTVHLNTSSEPVHVSDGAEVAPYNISATNNEYLAVAAFGPDGGMIGGYTEAQFIDDMRAHQGLAA
jgi:hypothetical protein